MIKSSLLTPPGPSIPPSSSCPNKKPPYNTNYYPSRKEIDLSLEREPFVRHSPLFEANQPHSILAIFSLSQTFVVIYKPDPDHYYAASLLLMLIIVANIFTVAIFILFQS